MRLLPQPEHVINKTILNHRRGTHLQIGPLTRPDPKTGEFVINQGSDYGIQQTLKGAYMTLKAITPEPPTDEDLRPPNCACRPRGAVVQRSRASQLHRTM